MGGWTDGWMVRWVNKWMARRVDGQKGGWLDG